MNDITTFSNPEFGNIRTVEQHGEPWFVGKDVAQALGYGEGKSLANAVADHVAAEDKGVTEMMTPGGRQKMTIINESGLYSLILSSKMPKAKEFTRWVTHEVLPAIRKTGSYSVSPYKPKASSVGEVIKLVEVTCSMMEDQGCDPMEIAQAVKQICDQFNINLPDFFVRPKEMTIQDAMDMVDFIYSHERGRGKRKPTYQEFVEIQVTLKRLEGSAQ